MSLRLQCYISNLGEKNNTHKFKRILVNLDLMISKETFFMCHDKIEGLEKNGLVGEIMHLWKCPVS